jgi:hypothetical protein
MVVYGYLRKADLQYVDWETLNHFHTDTWYHAQSQELLCNGMVMQSQLAHGARFSHAQGSKRQSVFSSLFWMSTLAVAFAHGPLPLACGRFGGTSRPPAA